MDQKNSDGDVSWISISTFSIAQNTEIDFSNQLPYALFCMEDFFFLLWSSNLLSILYTFWEKSNSGNTL